MNKKPSKWLKYCLDNFVDSKKTALDLACGKGRHSLYLADCGYNVLAVDINGEHLKHFEHSRIKKINKNVEDVKNWPLYKASFDVIVVTNFLNRSIFPLIINSINLYGYLIYETFSIGQEKIGRPSNKNFILQTKELISLCNSLLIIKHEEVWAYTPEKQYFKQRIICKNVR